VELIRSQRGKDRPWFLAVGFVRPHVPFVAPRKYFEPYLPYEKLPLPEKRTGDWDDIPKAGINYKTSVNMKMDERRQKKALGGYYACVSYMDAQVGRVLTALRESGLEDNTIVIFTSDHGYHLGEHDFWAKVSLLDESSKVPLIIRVPGKAPVVCDSLVELLEMIGRVAHFKFKDNAELGENMTLAQKIEHVLDIMLKLVNVPRKERSDEPEIVSLPSPPLMVNEPSGANARIRSKVGEALLLLMLIVPPLAETAMLSFTTPAGALNTRLVARVRSSTGSNPA